MKQRRGGYQLDIYPWILRGLIIPFGMGKQIAVCAVVLMLMAWTVTGSSNKEVSMTCGTCSNRTGCIGNKCLKVTGDFQDQVCYGDSTCNFAANTSMSMGLCQKDYTGNACPSGLCSESAKVNSCVDTGGQCPTGSYFSGTCSGKLLTMNFSGGVYGSKPITVSLDNNEACTFRQVAGSFSSCTGDSFGTVCDCCSTVTIQGLGSSSTGICVQSSSPLVGFKSSIQASSGWQGYFVFFLISLLALFL